MDKIKRLINVVIPITVCNFKCHYCYLAQTNSFDKNIPKLQYDMLTIKNALSKERLGGPCMMNLCAVGETLLAPYLLDLTNAMLDNGHYVTIVTNGSLTNKIKEYCKLDEDKKKRLFFKFSYQFLELKRLNLLDTFFENVKMVRDSGISYTVELTANDKSIPYIDEITQKCIDNCGAIPHIIESRDNNNNFKKLTKLSNKEHMENWNKFDTDLIKFQDSIWGEHRNEFCYAGDWISTLYLESGNFAPCFAGGPIIQNIFEDINEVIHFCSIGNKCPWEHCYAGYVLLTLGVIPNFEAPTYAQLRNRKTVDGKDWLQPEMKRFMESRFNESNKEYTNSRKEIINWYRDIEFNNKYDYNIKFSKALENTLKKERIKSVAIYENTKYQESLIDGLLHTSIKVKCIISPNYIETNSDIKTFFIHRCKYLGKRILRKDEIPVLNLYDSIPKVDAVLVTDIMHFGKIKKQINEKLKTKVILITELGN